MVDNAKMIRFIDSDYKELFQIPDGGSIKIIYPPGDNRGTIARQCKFLDEYHTRVGNETYHICEFAENMERIGARYEPEVQLRGMKLEPFTPGDEKYYTYNREEGNSCVGHIAGNFGQNGDRFHNGWNNHITRSEQDWSGTSPEFQTELHSAVYALRYQYNFLKDSSSMRALCDACPEALIDSGDKYQRYGFKLETDTRQYYTQCFFGESMRDARFIIYAYENPAPELEQTQLWEVIPGTADESSMFYRNDEADGGMSVGYLRGDYGKGGNEFHHSWFDSDNGKNTPEFKSEFQAIMNGLRKDILKDLKSSQDFCSKHPQAQLPGDIHRYGFKVETKNRQFYVRCTVIPNDYFYVFAYDKGAVREQERQASDKPSVMKQIRDAEKAPKPPRKPKSQDKKKDGAEL